VFPGLRAGSHGFSMKTRCGSAQHPKRDQFRLGRRNGGQPAAARGPHQARPSHCAEVGADLQAGGEKKPSSRSTFTEGDSDPGHRWAFKDFQGEVIEVSGERSKLKKPVSIFGREKPQWNWKFSRSQAKLIHLRPPSLRRAGPRWLRPVSASTTRLRFGEAIRSPPEGSLFPLQEGVLFPRSSRWPESVSVIKLALSMRQSQTRPLRVGRCLGQHGVNIHWRFARTTTPHPARRPAM